MADCDDTPSKEQSGAETDIVDSLPDLFSYSGEELKGQGPLEAIRTELQTRLDHQTRLMGRRTAEGFRFQQNDLQVSLDVELASNGKKGGAVKAAPRSHVDVCVAWDPANHPWQDLWNRRTIKIWHPFVSQGSWKHVQDGSVECVGAFQGFVRTSFAEVLGAIVDACASGPDLYDFAWLLEEGEALARRTEAITMGMAYYGLQDPLVAGLGWLKWLVTSVDDIGQEQVASALKVWRGHHAEHSFTPKDRKRLVKRLKRLVKPLALTLQVDALGTEKVTDGFRDACVAANVTLWSLATRAFGMAVSGAPWSVEGDSSFGYHFPMQTMVECALTACRIFASNRETPLEEFLGAMRKSWAPTPEWQAFLTRSSDVLVTKQPLADVDPLASRDPECHS